MEHFNTMHKTKHKTKVLFIGYDHSQTILHGGALQKLGQYEVTAADSAKWGKELYSNERFDVIVLGFGLTKEESLWLTNDIKQITPSTRIIKQTPNELPNFVARLFK